MLTYRRRARNPQNILNTTNKQKHIRQPASTILYLGFPIEALSSYALHLP
jgi:hypothetical protein